LAKAAYWAAMSSFMIFGGFLALEMGAVPLVANIASKLDAAYTTAGAWVSVNFPRITPLVLGILGGNSPKIGSDPISTAREIGSSPEVEGMINVVGRQSELTFNDESETTFMNCQRCVSAAIKSMMSDENQQSSQFPQRVNNGSIEQVLNAIKEDTGVTFGPGKVFASGQEARLPSGYYIVFTGLGKNQAPADIASHVLLGSSEATLPQFFDPQIDKPVSIWGPFKAYQIEFP
jgi:hypothetical protein